MSMTLETSKVATFRANWPKTTLAFNAEVLASAEKTLGTLDFPTTRVERWKYTRVTKISNKTFELGASLSIDKLPNLPFADAMNVVFVNGIFNAELSSSELVDGITVKSIADANEAANYLGSSFKLDTKFFASLNTLHATDGAFISIDANKEIEKPIQIVYVSTGVNNASAIRNVIVANKFSKARITQVFVSADATDCFSNVVSEYFLEENANLTVDKLENESESNLFIGLDVAKQPKNSTFTLNTITLNGGLVRNNVYVDVEGQNCYTYLNGAYILKGSQHVDNHTTIDHLVANCESDEMFKGVIDEQATGVFNGKVFVRPDAQKINAYQSNGNVLLSDSASVNSKPELEIYADDVKCSHGSTTGQLDEDAIFYLRARGLSEKSAKALMVTAFISDVLDRIDNEELIEYIHQVLEERFGWSF